MGQVDINKEQKRSGIMDAGFRLFTKNGVAKTSVADITKESGVAKGTFYLYFRDKYDLQDRLIAQQAEKLFRHALLKSDYREKEEPAEQICAILDDILHELSKNRLLLRFINKNLSWGVFRRAIDRSDTDYTAVFEEIMGTGPEKRRELQIYIYMVIELVGSSCLTVILDDDPVSLKEYLPFLHHAVGALFREFIEMSEASEGTVPLTSPN